ncbi:MAG TPA: hypothetical protein VH418_21415 [Solirubrobacteraceae bacterium]|jgi:hypothetical protein
MTSRSAVALVALALLAAGCGGSTQADSEPSGQFRVEVSGATFPARQQISHPVTLRILVRNADHRTVPNIAVTVETRPAIRGQAPIAFGQHAVDPRLADSARPVWILDRGPAGGDTAYTNTWALGALAPGRSRLFTWHLVPARAGAYVVTYRLSPGLTGKAQPAGGRVSGSLRAVIGNRPVAACVGGHGQVIKGPAAASGRC